MLEVQILAAESGSARRAFLEFPYRLYAQDAVWVAPLRRDQKRILDIRRHPFYGHAESRLFVARRGRDIVGRIAAIVDHNAPPEHGKRVGSFGFFESIDDPETTRGLLAAAREWLRERGMHLVRGPMNPSYNYGGAILVDGFEEPPSIGTPYNPPYYDRLLTGAGLRGHRDFLAFQLTRDQLHRAQALAGRFGAAVPGARLRPFDVRQFEREARWIYELHTTGFTKNYDFAPLSMEEVREIARDIERYGDPRLVQFCEVDGRPAGIVVALPDWNQALGAARGRLFPLGWWRILRARRNIRRIRIFLLCMAPEWQGTGLAATFLTMADQPGSEQYTEIEASWIVESHPIMPRALALLGARTTKRYRVYEGDVD